MYSILFLWTTILSLCSAIMNYGNYCGLGYSNDRGIQPIDELDRACQIHDICVTAGSLLDCFCNEQLYDKLSEFNPQTSVQASNRDADISLLYTALFGCSNYPNINTKFYIPYFNTPSSRGFTYFPLYTDDGYRLFSFYDHSNVRTYITDKSTFNNSFTTIAYNNPSRTWIHIDNDDRYSRWTFTSRLLLVRPRSVMVFINEDGVNNGFIQFVEADNYTADGVVGLLGRIDSLTSQIDTLKMQLNSKDLKIDDLNIEINYLYDALGYLITNLTERDAEVNILNTELNGVVVNLTLSNEREKSLNAEIGNANRNVTTRNKEIASLLEQYHSSQSKEKTLDIVIYALIGFISVVLLSLLGYLMVWCYRKRKEKVVKFVELQVAGNTGIGGMDTQASV